MFAIVFPGQGAQHEGMGSVLYNENQYAKELFDQANDLLGFDITSIMFEGSKEALTETKVTQPAVFLNAIITFLADAKKSQIDACAGHSLGEFSALVANGVLSFKDALILVSKRAVAMQKACDEVGGTMAAIIGLDNNTVEDICKSTPGVVVAANYNCPGQLVISGAVPAIEAACDACKEAGARRALILQVGGAFHSPLMQPAREELAQAILDTSFGQPKFPIYQNFTGQPETDPDQIKKNLIAQLTAPVKWTQTMQNMQANGITEITEYGAKVLSGFFKRFDRSIQTNAIT